MSRDLRGSLYSCFEDMLAESRVVFLAIFAVFMAYMCMQISVTNFWNGSSHDKL